MSDFVYGLLGLAVMVFIYKFFIQGPAFPVQSIPSPKSIPSRTSVIKGDGDKGKPAVKKGPKLSIYYGSQTGTAEGFSKRLVEEGKRNGFNASMIDLEEFDADTLSSESLCIFVVATYGEGDPTDSAIEFTKWLNKAVQPGSDVDETFLASMNYTVFGLGNKQYEFYNKMGKILDTNLEKIGATRLFEKGEGDDDANIEEDFDSWKNKMWECLCKKYFNAASSSAGLNSIDPPVFQFKSKVIKPKFDENGEEILFDGRPRANSSEIGKVSGTTRDYFDAKEVKVVVHRELRKDTENGSTIHLEVDVAGKDLNYETADNLGVLPENAPSTVAEVASLLGYDVNTVFDLEPVTPNTKPIIPTPSTIGNALSRYIDLSCKVSKHTLSCLSFFATDPKEKAHLLHLVSPEGKGEYNSWINEAWRTLPEVLQAHPSIKIDIGNLLEITSRLAVRFYTISSSSIVHPQRIHLTVSLVKQQKTENRLHLGVCSSHMYEKGIPSNTKDGKRVHTSDKNSNKAPEWPSLKVILRKSTFRLPSDPSLPVILIGPGTGIAPMRAFLHERSHQRKNGIKVGATILYFGSRNQDKDFIYEDEILSFTKDGTLTDVQLAFSRDGLAKVYVQHKLKETGSKLWNYLNQGAYIYVCGGTSMGADVLNTFISIAEEHGKLPVEKATKFVKDDLKGSGRYVQELWS